jgi:tetratricopeptide (TPR) repeat protein
VEWGEVDLRWGITDEEKAEGQVLPLCLEEIERCHPFFICLLGNRYGSRPDAIPRDLIERHPWLKNYADRSVTELEIIHGALLRPQECAYFYFRDPGNMHAGDDPKDHKEDDADSIAKLADLKKRIRTSFQVKSYADDKTLGEHVLADFRALIDRLFPEERNLPRWKREFRRHDSYASRFTDYYLIRAELHAALNDFAKGDGSSPLVIAAETGGGKTALLANWAAEFRNHNPNECILTHYAGASGPASKLAAFCDRIAQELRARLRLNIAFNDDEIHSNLPPEVTPSLAKLKACLEAAARATPVTLVLDGIDRLDTSEADPDCTWLQDLQSSKARWIVSTSPGRILDQFRRHNVRCMDIPALREEPDRPEISTMTKQYLWTFYSKKLSQERQQRIAQWPLAANPLSLVSILEEVRLFGEREKLDEQIGLYTRNQTAEGLYDQILQRWEQDYEGSWPNLVRDALGFLWASRYGLSESELLGLLGSNGESLPYAVWAPLARAADRWIVNHSDRLKLLHDSVRDAVRVRYLKSQTYLRSLRLKLADFFRIDPHGVPSLTIVYGNVEMYSAGGYIERVARVVDEVPWQLSQAREWAKLAEWLAVPAHVAEWSPLSNSDFQAYWAQIERNSTERMVKTYAGVIRGEQELPPSYRERVVGLLRDCGYASEALAIQDRSAVADDGEAAFAFQLGEEALTLERLGRTREAIQKLEKQVDLYRQLGDDSGLSRAVGNLGGLLIMHDIMGSDAMSLLKEQEQICLRLRDNHGLAASLGNQGLAMLKAGQYQEARPLLTRQETLCRSLANRQDLSICLCNQALVEMEEGHNRKAFKLLRQQEEIVRDLGYVHGLQACLKLQSQLHIALGDLRSAMTLAREREKLCRSHGMLLEQIGALETQAQIYEQLDNTEEVLRVQDELVALARGLDDGGLALATCLGNKALTLMAADEEATVVAVLDEASEIYLRHEQHDKVTLIAHHKAKAYFSQGMVQRAVCELDLDLVRCRARGDQKAVTSLLGDKAAMLVQARKLEEARPILEEVEVRCRQEGDQEGLAVALTNLAAVAYGCGDVADFCRPAEEALAIARRIGREDIVAQLEPALRDVKRFL